MTTLILSAIIFAIYPAWIAIRFGVKKSISITHYTLEKWKKNSGFIFTIWLWAFLGLLFQHVPNDFYIVAIMIEFFIGASPAFWRYWKGQEWKVHMVASYGGIIVGLIGSAIAVGWWYPIPALAIAATIRFTCPKTYVWWIEVLAYYAIVLPLFFI